MNKRRENAIQIMAVWSKKKKDVKFLDCFKFLVEVVWEWDLMLFFIGRTCENILS